MTIQMILAPLFVQVLLTFALGFWHVALRAPRADARRDRGSQDVALREPNWPPRATQIANSLSATSSNCRCCSTC